MINLFLKEAFYFGIIVDLLKNFKGNTKRVPVYS